MHFILKLQKSLYPAFKPFMRYRGNNICLDKQTNEQTNDCRLQRHKSDPGIFSCNSSKHCQILIIFGRTVTVIQQNMTSLWMSVLPGTAEKEKYKKIKQLLVAYFRPISIKNY